MDEWAGMLPAIGGLILLVAVMWLWLEPLVTRLLQRCREQREIQTLDGWEPDGDTPATREKILVADDEPHLVRLVGLTLRRSGYAVITTPRWEKVLDLARSTRPALIILDVFMPRRDADPSRAEPTGCEVVKALRADPSVADIPVILLAMKSARSDDFPPCTDLPPDTVTYFFKPFLPRELLPLVRQLLHPGRQP